MHLTQFIQPSAAADIPQIDSSMSSQDVMKVMLLRMERLEKKSQAQDLAYKLLKDSTATDSKTHDRYDELTNRLVQTERRCDRQEKKVKEFENRLASLANAQSRSLKMINAISQKINAISSIAWDKRSVDGSKVLAVSFNSIIEKTTPAEFINDNALVAVNVFKEAMVMCDNNEDSADDEYANFAKNKVDGPRVAATKSALKEMHRARSWQSDAAEGRGKEEEEEGRVEAAAAAPPVGSTRSFPMPFPDHLFDQQDEVNSQFTMDSNVMIDEFVMDKLATLEKQVNELIATKLDRVELSEHLTAGRLSEVQDGLHDAERMHAEQLQLQGGMPGAAFAASSNPTVLKENAFRLLIRDTKAAWDLAFAELDKKVNKMDSVIKQLDSQPDEIHRRLSAFRDKVTHALEVISVALPESREDIITAIYDTMEDVRQDALQVVKIEEEIRHVMENKDPGQECTVSQIPTHLPELLQEACGKAAEVLSERIDKYDLSTRIDELATQLRTKVDLPVFLNLEEDLRIALTLKSDQRQMEAALEKKTSVIDMQKFREYVTDEIDSMRAMLANSSTQQRAAGHSHSHSHVQVAGQAGSSEVDPAAVAILNQRMDKLYRGMQETSSKLGGFVPRHEIETALQALLNEVKAIKGSSVDKASLEDRLLGKADATELTRLLSILEGTVGDPMSARAAIQKCLVCDKPVNPFLQNTTRPNSPTSYFDKPGGSGLSPSKQRPQTTGTGMPRSSSQPYPEKLRQTAEKNILRNSMESLPALDDLRQQSGNNNGVQNSARGSSRGAAASNLSAHSRRIRSAAGGGLGPSYAQDTR